MLYWLIFWKLYQGLCNQVSIPCSYEPLVYLSLTWCCQWITLSFEALVFSLIKTIGNLDQFSTGINKKNRPKAPSPTNSYEYGELSITTTKFDNFVSHRLKNDGEFLKWLFISGGSREPEAFKYLPLTCLSYQTGDMSLTWYMNHYDWWYGRHMFKSDHIASAEGSGT